MDSDLSPIAERDARLSPLCRPRHRQRGPRRHAPVGRRTVGDLLDTPTGDWVTAFRRATSSGRGSAPRGPSVRWPRRFRERASRGRMEVLHRGDPGYPERLAEVRDAPPVLFMRGTVGRPRRRLALVGTRHPEQGYLHRARAFAAPSRAVVPASCSGAAAGVDRACHLGALDVGGETWAFLGSALDEVDPAQARLVPLILDGGGAVVQRAASGNPGEQADVSPAKQTHLRCIGCGPGAPGRQAQRCDAHRGRRPCPGPARPRLSRGDLGGGGPGLQPAGGARTRHGSASSPSTRCGPWDSGRRRRPERWSRGRCRVCRPRRRSCTRWSTGSRGMSRSWRDRAGMDPGGAVSALCELELLGLVVQGTGRRYQRV
jgi:hypothetical protein